jgi:hypothetical protein
MVKPLIIAFLAISSLVGLGISNQTATTKAVEAKKSCPMTETCNSLPECEQPKAEFSPKTVQEESMSCCEEPKNNEPCSIDCPPNPSCPKACEKYN